MDKKKGNNKLHFDAPTLKYTKNAQRSCSVNCLENPFSFFIFTFKLKIKIFSLKIGI